ncbi:MAG TPA: GNAT family N-acetyltransferase [Alphaproteobacteria bacterium]|nr:GNAT family N-acetyltransferase [Alphaproteobacteria bacterium]
MADRAAVVKVLHRAFADYDGRMQPPPGALGETEASVRAHLKKGSIALAFIDGAPVGAMFIERKGDALFLSRVSVVPEKRGSGITARMVELAMDEARRQAVHQLTLRVRESLAQNVALFERLGFRKTGRHGHESHPQTIMIDMCKDI